VSAKKTSNNNNNSTNKQQQSAFKPKLQVIIMFSRVTRVAVRSNFKKSEGKRFFSESPNGMSEETKRNIVTAGSLFAAIGVAYWFMCPSSGFNKKK
jgi:hypothetical protein